jgi:hypothetical protein
VTARPWRLAIWGGLLVALVGVALGLLASHPDASVLVLVLAALPWWMGLRALGRTPDGRASRLAIAAVALAIRAPLIIHAPVGSDDYYRYLWDGRVARAHLDPYRFAPAAPELVPLRDLAVWMRINQKSIPTVYPPLAQLAFRACPSLSFWKMLVLFADVGIALALARWLRRRGADPRACLIWAWCPLVAYELALDAHVDALAILPMVVALSLCERPAAAGGWLGLAFAAKLLPAALLVPTVRARRVGYLAFAVAAGLCIAPYASSGWRLAAGMDVYARKWVANPGAYLFVYNVINRVISCPVSGEPVWRPRSATLARLVSGESGRLALYHDELVSALARLLIGIVIVGVLVWVTGRKLPPERAAARILLALFLLTPALLPWYLLFAVPLLARPSVERPALVALTATAPLLHLGYPSPAPAWAAATVHGVAWAAVCAGAGSWFLQPKRI